MANPDLDEAESADLVVRLIAARRAVHDAKKAAYCEAEAAAHGAVDEVKRALGERGPPWWDDGLPDFNRHMAKNTPYADGTRALLASATEDCELPKAAIFDLDGTLLDSVDLHAIAWQEDNTADRMAAVGGRCGEASHGEKIEDLPDFAGLLRSGDGRSVDESGSGSVGRRQQSLPPGCCEGEPRSGRHRGDHGKARRRSQAPGWNRPTFQRTRRAAHRSWRRKTNESRPQVERPKDEEAFLSSVDKAAERKAALAYEREQSRRELERAKEEAARQKERERRQQAVDKAQAALDKAEQEHAKRAAAIQAEVEALEQRSQAEKARWNKEKERLEAALRRARG